MTTFVLSIKPHSKPSYNYGFHLGTDARMARHLAMERFRNINRYVGPLDSVSLMRNGRVFDTFDGETWILASVSLAADVQSELTEEMW